MPTVLKEGPYSCVFFSSDWSEPPHIHVKRGRQMVKYWLHPVSLAKNRKFKEHELRKIARLVAKCETKLLEAWDDYFGA